MSETETKTLTEKLSEIESTIREIKDIMVNDRKTLEAKLQELQQANIILEFELKNAKEHRCITITDLENYFGFDQHKQVDKINQPTENEKHNNKVIIFPRR